MAEIIRSESYTVPGLYRMSEAAYHDDAPFDSPSLSRSVAEKLIMQSPAHAWRAHPKLGLVKEDEKEKNERRADIGSAAHALLLHQRTQIAALDFDDYRSKAAQHERSEARETGAIPLLRPDHELVIEMVREARKKLGVIEHPALMPLAGVDTSQAVGIAHNEVTALWLDRCGGLPARARLDRFYSTSSLITVIDYKTTEMSAAPDAVSRAIYQNNYHFQDAFYRRGLRHIFPEIDRHEKKLDFIFIVQEQEPPFEMSIVQIDASARLIGEKMVSNAFRVWRKCIETNDWPGYPTGIVTAEFPAFLDTKWCAREIEDPLLQHLPDDPLPPFETNPYRYSGPSAVELLGAG
jgi:hypothetical protein